MTPKRSIDFEVASLDDHAFHKMRLLVIQKVDEEIRTSWSYPI